MGVHNSTPLGHLIYRDVQNDILKGLTITLLETISLIVPASTLMRPIPLQPSYLKQVLRRLDKRVGK